MFINAYEQIVYEVHTKAPFSLDTIRKLRENILGIGEIDFTEYGYIIVISKEKLTIGDSIVNKIKEIVVDL